MNKPSNLYKLQSNFTNSRDHSMTLLLNFINLTIKTRVRLIKVQNEGKDKPFKKLDWADKTRVLDRIRWGWRGAIRVLKFNKDAFFNLKTEHGERNGEFGNWARVCKNLGERVEGFKQGNGDREEAMACEYANAAWYLLRFSTRRDKNWCVLDKKMRLKQLFYLNRFGYILKTFVFFFFFGFYQVKAVTKSFTYQWNRRLKLICWCAMQSMITSEEKT